MFNKSRPFKMSMKGAERWRNDFIPQECIMHKCIIIHSVSYNRLRTLSQINHSIKYSVPKQLGM